MLLSIEDELNKENIVAASSCKHMSEFTPGRGAIYGCVNLLVDTQSGGIIVLHSLIK